MHQETKVGLTQFAERTHQRRALASSPCGDTLRQCKRGSPGRGNQPKRPCWLSRELPKKVALLWTVLIYGPDANGSIPSRLT